MKIYIAGPDVFEKNAKDIGQKYKAICEKYSHTGLYPLDNECDSSEEIYKGNIALINEADAVIANGNEFRGEMDVGTAFEIGYADAARKAAEAAKKAAEAEAKKIVEILKNIK